MASRTRIETILVDGIILSSSSITEVSRYEHDCDTCIFVGRFEDYDLYFCPLHKSLIARHGTDGEYKSLGMETFIRIRDAGLMHKDDPLYECLLRVEDMGIY